MILSDYISIAALLIASLTFIYARIGFHKYDKKIKEFKLDKIEHEKASIFIAELEVRALPYSGGGKHTIRISNKGKCRAENIRMGKNTLTCENGVFTHTFRTVLGIEPLDKYDFILHCYEGVEQSLLITLLWDDKKQNNNEKEFYVNL